MRFLAFRNDLRRRRACLAVATGALLPAAFWALRGPACYAAAPGDAGAETVRLVPPQARGGVSWAAAVSADGRYGLTGGTEGVVILWEMATGREIRRFLGHVGKIEAVAFGPDNQTVWSGGHDKTIRHWNMATGREIGKLTGHTDWVTTLDVSPDGARVASGGNDGTVRLWDAAAGTQLWALEDQGYVSGVRFSPNGHTLLSAGGFQRLNLWDVESGSQLREFPRHASGVNTCAFSPNGKWVLSGEGYFAATNGVSAHAASAPEDCVVRVYDATTTQELLTLAGHQAAVLSAQFGTDSKTIVSAGDDGAVRVWDVPTGKTTHTFSVRAAGSPLHHIVFALPKASQAQTALVAVGDTDTARVWNVQTGRAGQTLEGQTLPLPFVAVSPNGRLAASIGYGDIRLWDVRQGRIVRRFAAPVPHGRAAFSPDGTLLATCGGDKMIRLWNVETGQSVRQLSGHTGVVTGVAFRPGGQEIASGSEDGTVRVWRVGDGALVRTIESGEPMDKNDLFGGPASWVTSVAYRSDGHAILVGYALANAQKRDTSPAAARLFDAGSGKGLAEVAAGTGGVWAVAFGKDGSALTSSGDETVRRWNTKTNQIDAQTKVEGIVLASTARDAVLPIAPAPSGSRVAIGGTNGAVYLWNPDEAGAPARPLPGAPHSAPVSGLVWASSAGPTQPNGVLLSAGGDDTQRVWDVNTTAPKGLLLTLLLLTEGDWMTIAPDGRFDASPGAVPKVHFARGMETFGAGQFFEQFYTPNLARLAQTGGVSAAAPVPVADAVEPARPVAATTEAALSQGMPPVVRIASPTTETAAVAEQATVAVEATEQNGGGVERVRIYVNGRLAGGEPTTTARGIAVEPPAAQSAPGSPVYTKNFTVTLAPGANVLRAVAFSRTGIESKPSEITVNYAPKDSPRPVLHVLAVGVNAYRDSTMNLQYARPDAESLTALFSDREKTRLFREVNCVCLTDADATGEAVRAAFDRLAQTATPGDVVVLYLAGHGETVPPDNVASTLTAPQFYFLPSDARQMAMTERVRQFGIGGNEITTRLAKIKAGKLVLIYDACKSGAALARGGFRGSDAEQQALVVLSRALGVHILTASTGTQYAGEVTALGHGILTYALLEGLNGKGNTPTSPAVPITVRALLSYVEERVPVLTKQYRSGEQWPVLSSNGQNFPLTVVK